MKETNITRREYWTNWKYAKDNKISLEEVARRRQGIRTCESCGLPFNTTTLYKNRFGPQKFCKRPECLKLRLSEKNKRAWQKKVYEPKPWGNKRESMYWAIVNVNKEREKKVEFKKPDPPPKRASGKWWWENGHMVKKNPPAVK